jgi:acyl-CoA synthetase (AMP-forming)/AMP-acid ligase II
MTSNPLPPAKRKPGTVGLGQGVEVRILNDNGEELPRGAEGEICIQGENVTKGYLNNPKANAEGYHKNGFFRTGDQGKKDEDGYIIITGRIKELINKGGEKISPIELDNVMTRHPAVSEAVSFAVPDEMYGQDVGVAIVRKSGEKLGEEELRKWMAERVAKFKLPQKVSLNGRGRHHENENANEGCTDLFHRYHAQDRNGQDPETNRCRDDDEAGKAQGEAVERFAPVDIDGSRWSSI